MFLVRICLIWVNQREYARPTPPQHRVRGLASGLLAFHSKLALYKCNCYSEHGRLELSNSSYVNTRPEPAQNHFMCCMAGVSGTGEAGGSFGKLMNRTLDALCRVRLNVAPGPVPRIPTNSRCISRPRGPHARYAWDCKRQTTHDYLHAQSLS